MQMISCLVGFFLMLPYEMWLDILTFCFWTFYLTCGFYFLFIGPAIYRFWIISRIKNRYNINKLVFSNPAYANSKSYGIFWAIPATEISFYIVCKYMGWKIALMNNPHAALNKINYDIKTASKAEIVMSFIGFFVFCILVLGPVFIVIQEKYIDPQVQKTSQLTQNQMPQVISPANENAGRFYENVSYSQLNNDINLMAKKLRNARVLRAAD